MLSFTESLMTMRSAAAWSTTTCRRSGRIVNNAKAKNYRLSAFISGVANSAALSDGGASLQSKRPYER
jgi:hypothetical protein